MKKFTDIIKEIIKELSNEQNDEQNDDSEAIGSEWEGDEGWNDSGAMTGIESIQPTIKRQYMKKSELKEIIKECIRELHEGKKVAKGGPAVKKIAKTTSIGKGPSTK